MGSLTSTQNEIIVGSLLGDGTLRKQGTRTNALFEANHSFRYKSYVDWKYKHFEEFILTPPKSRKGNGKRIAYRFTTRSLPVFTQYYNSYYRDKRKVIPTDLEITKIVLAVWFMDDGSKSRNTYYLNTQQFSIVDQKMLIDFLERDFKVKSSLNKDKNYYRIRIRTNSANLFLRVIEPFILPIFWYKLAMTP